MKKIVSILMASAMVMVLSLSAFATSPTTSVEASGVDASGNAIVVDITPVATPSSADQDEMKALIASVANSDALSVFASIDIALNDGGEGPYTLTATIKGLGTSGYSDVFLFHEVNGVWEKVTIDSISGDVITFTVDSFSPFAVMIEKTTSPVTGVSNGLSIVLAVAALATGVAFISTRKRTA